MPLDILAVLSIVSPHKRSEQIHGKNFHQISTKDYLSSRSVKTYANFISSIRSPGLPKAAGKVSVCSHPTFTNSIVTFSRDAKLEQDEHFGVVQVSHYCFLNLHIIIEMELKCQASFEEVIGERLD